MSTTLALCRFPLLHQFQQNHLRFLFFTQQAGQLLIVGGSRFYLRVKFRNDSFLLLDFTLQAADQLVIFFRAALGLFLFRLGRSGNGRLCGCFMLQNRAILGIAAVEIPDLSVF